MAQVWTCPACGAQNGVDQTECSTCGRWASVFDLERPLDVGEAETAVVEDEWQPLETADREPVIPAGQRPSAGELARTVLDTLRERGPAGPEAEAEVETEPNRAGGVVKWLVIALVLLWFVLPPLLDAIS